MLKDRIVKLESGIEYVIIEEMTYKNSMYVLCAECNEEKDTVDENQLYAFQINYVGEQIKIDTIEDDVLAAEVTEALMQKIQNS